MYFILQMNKGKEIVMERENGEEIYAKDSMKLEGVRVNQFPCFSKVCLTKKNALLQKGTFRQNLNRTFNGMSFNTTRRK